jgi:tellurium resistance protein TerD
MAINLNKSEGSSINLTKSAPALKNITVHLWWNGNVNPIDLDVSAFILTNTPNGPKLIGDEYLVFFNNETPAHGIAWKTKDERGSGVEELYINIDKLAAQANADEVSIVVTIDKAKERGHTFGQITEAGIKILNADTGEEIAFYDLDEQGAGATACQVGSFFKQNGEFTFAGVGAMFDIGLGEFVGGYS